MSEVEPPQAWSLAAFQAMMSRCPFNRWLGLQALSIGEEGVEILLPWREELLSSPEAQSMHGGVLASAIDAAASYAVAFRVGHGIPTVDLRIDYHRVAKPGDYTVRGRVIHFGRTFASGEAHVYDAGKTLIASGRGLFFSGSQRSGHVQPALTPSV
jgi:uncharacterized protein (TIGR00369 family)